MKRHIRFDWTIKRLLRQKANFGILEGFLSELLKEDVNQGQTPIRGTRRMRPVKSGLWFLYEGTARTSKLTLNFCRRTFRIAVRLSIVGLPLADSIL
ncbi:MAG: hypothetical protein D3910_23250 [Candidatus Electrothrix sp. ATG2]|nr:hypothetical protein [Candidatus Electrothrix sp. ATG2]